MDARTRRFSPHRFAAGAAAAVTAAAAALLLVSPAAQAQRPAGAPPGPAGAAAKAVHPVVTLVTSKGTILIKLYPEEAPKTVENYIKLIKKGFYNGLTFHRVDPGFVIQGGDPKGNGQGGPGYTIPDEKNPTLKHNRGAVAMAKSSAPNSAGSQFYIVIAKPAPHLDGGYTVFGQVIQGQEVAEKIAVGDKMLKVTVTP